MQARFGNRNRHKIFRQSGYAKDKFIREAKVIHIDVDAAEINKNISSDLSIIGDVKEVLDELLPLVKEAKHDEWLAQIDEWRKLDYKPKDKEGVLRPHQIIQAISDEIGEDGIIVTTSDSIKCGRRNIPSAPSAGVFSLRADSARWVTATERLSARRRHIPTARWRISRATDLSI